MRHLVLLATLMLMATAVPATAQYVVYSNGYRSYDCCEPVYGYGYGGGNAITFSSPDTSCYTSYPTYVSYPTYSVSTPVVYTAPTYYSSYSYGSPVVVIRSSYRHHRYYRRPRYFFGLY